MQKYAFFLLILISSLNAISQPGRIGQKATGRVYGKIMDEGTKTPVEYAVIQVFRASDSSKKELINGALTASNGDFNIDKIPVGESMLMVVSFVGYQTNQSTFIMSASYGMGSPEKDLGNIKLKISTELTEVVVDGSDPAYRIA